MKKLIITIDGHSACGKSTLARALAAEIDYGYIDTGAMYRAVTYYFLENRVNIQKRLEVEKALSKINIHFKSTVGGNRTYLNGADVEDAIRKMFVSKSVSHVAAMSVVRKKVVKQQQEMGRQKGIVMEGRDIGTVVFPKAELKIFLTADKDVRTKRRHDELKSKGQKVSIQAVKKNLLERDHIDSTRKDSPLKQAKEAVIIDNTNISPREQLAMVTALAKERIRVINLSVKPSASKPTPKPAQKKPTPSKSKTQKTNTRTAKANTPNKKSKPTVNTSQQNSKTSNTNKRKVAPKKATNTNRKPNPNQPNQKKQTATTKSANQKRTPQKRTPQKPVHKKTTPQKANTTTNKTNNPNSKKVVTKKAVAKPNSKQNPNNKKTVSKPKPKRTTKPPASKQTPQKPKPRPQPKKQNKPKPQRRKTKIDDDFDDLSY